MLTGSRTAAAAGRIPPIDVATSRLSHWQTSGLKVHDKTFCMATFVDNLFAVARTHRAAIDILDDCASELHRCWGLAIGADSREFLVCKGYASQVNADEGWTRSKAMRVLGHFIDEDGGVSTCLSKALVAMHRSFYGNLTPGLKQSSKAAKFRFLTQSISTIARFRWSRWPYSSTTANKLDSCQRRFLIHLFDINPGRCATVGDFYLRRHQAAERLAATMGKWSAHWVADLRSWASHVQRGHDGQNWSSPILAWRDAEWMQQRRFSQSAAGESRTNTRAIRGGVRKRWQESFRDLP